MVNFDPPPKYNQYKENGTQINDESISGSMLSLVMTSKNEEEIIDLY